MKQLITKTLLMSVLMCGWLVFTASPANAAEPDRPNVFWVTCEGHQSELGLLW